MPSPAASGRYVLRRSMTQRRPGARVSRAAAPPKLQELQKVEVTEVTAKVTGDTDGPRGKSAAMGHVAGSHGPRGRHLHWRVRWPVALREHVHRQLDVLEHRISREKSPNQ